MNELPLHRGTSHKRLPLDHHRAPGLHVVLLQGLRGRHFLMSEVPRYAAPLCLS